MNETSQTPQQDDTKASYKASWIKPELIQLNGQDAEGKAFSETFESDTLAAPS